METTDAELKSKTLPKGRKLCETAGRMLGGKDEEKVDRNITIVQDQNKEPRPIKVKQDTGEDDLSYFVCSMIAELNARNMVS